MTRSLTIASLLLTTLLPACAIPADGDESHVTAAQQLTCELGEVRSCMDWHHEAAVAGSEECVDFGDGPEWSACEGPYHEDNCPGDTEWDGTCCREPVEGPSCCAGLECITPLVVAYDDTVAFSATPGAFDIKGEGSSYASDWPTAATPWLAFDRDGNGHIDSGSELFGNATSVGEANAAHGFEALAQHDADGDGFITERDPIFAQLLLWGDRDSDRLSSQSELQPAAQKLVAIELAAHLDLRCDDRGNCETLRSRFWYQDGLGGIREGAIVDVTLASQ